jgi:hypothetical protein
MEDDDEHGGGHAGEGRPGAGSTAAKLLYKAIQEDDLETIRRLVEGKVRAIFILVEMVGGREGEREGGMAGKQPRRDPRRYFSGT